MSGSTGPLPALPGLGRIIDNSGQSWSDSEWWLQLQPGSWRGVGFVMDTAETRAGRRVAIHEYPYRDTAWVEDLGKLPRRFAMQAFLVGDDVYSQRDAMVAACEQAGSGTLVHPTLGSAECVLLDFAVSDRRERGRVVEVTFNFLQASAARLPVTTQSSLAAVNVAIGHVNAAMGADLGTAMLAGRVPQVATNVAGYTNMAIASVNDATRALNAVRGLAGYYGRYAGGRRADLLPAASTVQSVLSDATVSRTAVLRAAASVGTLAGLL
jgi:prophage DNA circulation protein